MLDHVLAELGHVDPVRLTRVRAHDPRAAGVGHNRHPVAPGDRLLGQQCGHVEELVERVGADHTGLVEQRVDGHVGGGQQRPGVRRGGPRPGGRSPTLHGQNRLLARHPRRQPRELARVAERLEVQQRDVGARVLLPELEEVVARQVGLVPDRDERRQAESEPPGRLDDRDAEPAALRQEADLPRHRRVRREGGVQMHVRVGVEDPEAVRPDQTHPGCPADLDQLSLALSPLLAGLGEAGRNDKERTDSGGGALASDVRDPRGGHNHDAQVDRPWDVGDRVVGG